MENIVLVNKTEFLCCRILFVIFVHDVIYVDINKGTEAASHIHWSWNHSDQKNNIFPLCHEHKKIICHVIPFFIIHPLLASRSLYNPTILI